MPRSALVVTVEAAEAIVASYRLEHDRMAARGVPAHVTVLHPFRSLVDDDAASRVAAIVRGVAPFMATFTSFGRFADGAVLFLAPEPAERFVDLTRRVFAEFSSERTPSGRTERMTDSMLEP